jgi:hypothetical protein
MSVAVRLRPVAACACALLLQACASSSHVLVGQARAPISPDQVRVYLEPPPHYEQVAALDASSGGFFGSEQSKMDAAVAKLKAEAAKVGANGVLLQAVENQQSGSIGVGVGGTSVGGNSATSTGVGGSGGLYSKVAKALAIYVPPEAQGTSPAPSPVH